MATTLLTQSRACWVARAYHNPTRPETAFKLDGQGSLREWAKAARSAPLEAARVAQNPKINAYIRVKLNACQALGHRQYQSFDPTNAPLHFLDAVRYALAACVASQDLEHFWATFNLEWPDGKTRSNVSFRQVPPLHCLVTTPVPGTLAEGGEAQPMEEVHSSSSEEECQDTEVQVHNWRFSELETTDLATLREVDLCVPFQFPSINSAHWRNYVSFPSSL